MGSLVKCAALLRVNRILRTRRGKQGFTLGITIDKSVGGTDELSNLRALCSICNEGAKNLTPDRPSLQKLLIQIRRAPGTEQLAVLEWLVRKYPIQATSLLKR